ncbi:MAG TPA: SpvB/TcaC N-terminal domain-containing protein [Baekduia sp.]|uniref:SpvB/TcaC N-terminal domain-containing protein n=1 Tax=Baekduia sp. TaxID=2600305 RepID=UPI002CE0274C|nr:SpvB/TcaC N-terminal domain-containing protein [Baekduia sp.]HMJ33144.1 SpvB/TcaC N-terminal domain-containing protein [Baekduia sp.]
MAESPTVVQPTLALPRGGGALKGLGGGVGSGTVTGDATLAVDAVVTAARALTPSATLAYSSAAGNGPFGMGFSLAPAAVTRRTGAGVPAYRATDTIDLAGIGALTPALRHDPKTGAWAPLVRTASEAGHRYRITTFRPRLETDLPLVEQWERAGDGLIHWVVTTADGTVERYGISVDGRVADPDRPDERVAAWLLQERTDTKGNRAVYTYLREDDAGAAAAFEGGHAQTAQRYPAAVRYGNYVDRAGAEQFALELVFDYGERDLDHLDQPGADPYAPVRPWPRRDDSFSSYAAGFEVRTARLCRAVLMFHHFPDELGATPCLVSSLCCSYDETPALSRIVRVTRAGHRRRADGSYASAVLPPLDVAWSTFAPPPAPRFRTLRVDGGGTPAGELERGDLQPVDLHGEGLTGLLYSDAATTYYYAPEGDGAYARPATPRAFPNVRDLRDPRLSLEDLDGDGQLELVVVTPTEKGYFPRGEDGGWQTFTPFARAPNVLGAPDGELVDLDGSGRSDLLRVHGRTLVAYPSRGGDGYGAEQVAQRPPGFPASPRQTGGRQLVTFAGVFGDGLAHRVRVADGEVEVWPSLGHGRFGAPVRLHGAPAFAPGTTPDRIFFADVDGSGTADLVLAYGDHLDIYLNQAGNGFAPAIAVALPLQLGALGRIAFADVLGTGTTAVVATSAAPGLQHWFCDLSDGVKPYLVTGIDDHVGLTAQLEYAPSTRFALEDRRAGRPWTTRLPFPVHVVAKVTLVDAVAGTRLARRHRYRDGWFDPAQREFRGFGFVESWDAESFDELAAAARADDRLAAPRAELHAAPVRTRSWFQVGSLRQADALRQARAREQFDGDTDAYNMPANVLDQASRAAGAPTLGEAYTSLTGRVLRTEVYADDGGPAADVPYTVTDTSYTVRMIQPARDGARGAFHVQARETVDADYERRTDDPRVTHTFAIEDTLVDDDGATTSRQRTITINYPRRDGAAGPTRVPEQGVALATLSETIRTRVLAPFRMVGAPVQQRAIDLGGLHVAPGAYLTFAAAATFADAALAAPIDYGTAFSGTAPQSRAAAISRTFYWDEAQATALPLGAITARALRHHGAEAAFPPSWVTAVYGDFVTPADLTVAGYALDDATATWWSHGLVATYHRPDEPDQYFLLAETGRPGGGAGPFSRTTVAYDAPYRVRPVRLTAAVDATTALASAALLDYQALRPWQLTDPNGVVTQALPDPLGGVVATSTFRLATATQPRVGDGDLSDYVVHDGATFAAVLDDPLTYLQDAGAFFLTDLHAVTASDPRPLTTVALQRPRYASDGPAIADELAVRVTLWDGTGRAAAQFAVCGPDERGPDAAAGGPPVLWRVSGRVVYDNKGRPVEEYLSTWSTQPAPDRWRAGGPAPATGAPPPEVTRYDPLGRPIRVDTPKGFFTRLDLTPWEERRYDADDTVLESDYYRDFLAHLLPLPTPDEQAELDALEQAAKAYNTPSIAVLDPAARAVRHIRDNLGAVPAARLEPVVHGTVITAQQLWYELIDKGYLATRDVAPVGTWLTDRFDPYAAGFVLALDPPFDQLADAITAFLLEGRVTDLRVLDQRGRAVRLVDPRLYLDEVRTATPRANLRCAYPMGANEPARTDSADAGPRWMLADVAGNAVLAADGRGLRTARTFDGLDRPVTATVRAGDGPRALRERFTYGEGRHDAAAHGLIGRLWRAEDGAGRVTTPDYGIDGQPRTTVRQFAADASVEPDWSQPVALAPEEYATGTAFDATGALVAETPPGGAAVRWAYHRSGKLRAVTVDPAAGGARVTVASALRYDAAGQRVAVTFGNGVTQASTYELTTGRLLTLRSARADGAPVQEIAYTCDPVGNVTRVRDTTARHAYCAAQPEGRADLAYDPLYRLREATGLQLPGLAADTYATGFKQTVFAPLCATGDGPPSVLEAYSESYDYDLAGNLVALAHRAPSGDWDRAMPVAAGSNRMADGAYDAAGNTLSIQLAAPVALTWDDRGMLASAVAPAASTTFYNYDAALNRARRRVDAADGSWAERRYLGFCLVDLASDAEAPATTLRVGDGAGTFATLAGDAAQPQVRWELDDRLGSVGVQLDADGAVVSYEAFLPYGGSSAISAADEATVAPKTHRFSGKETDDSTALTYYGVRYAMPWLGRWLSPDPSGPIDGLNLYAYVNGNPMTLVDRDGSCGNDPSRPPQPPNWRSLYANFQQEAFNQFVNAPRRFFMGVGAVGMFPFSPQLRQQRREYFVERRHLIREAGTGLGIVGFIPSLVWQHFDAGTRPWAMRPGANGESPIQIAGRQINRNNYVAGYAGGWVGQWLSVSTALSFAWTYRTWGQSVSWPRYFRGWAGVSMASFLIMREGRAAQARQDYAMVQRRLAQHDPRLPEAYNQLGELTGLPQSAALFYGESERARPFADISPWAFGALVFGVVGARVFVGYAARRAIPRALAVIQPRETALVVWRPPAASQTPKTPASK